MKRVICIIFALLLMLALCACEGDAYIYIGNTDSGTSQSSGTDGTVNSNITASSVIEGNGDGQADFVAPDNSSNTSSTTSEDKKGGFLGFIGDLLGGNKDKDKDKNSSSLASSSENTTTETSSETSAPTSSNTTTDSSKEESKPVSSSSQQTSSVPMDPFENSSNWVIVDIPQK